MHERQKKFEDRSKNRLRESEQVLGSCGPSKPYRYACGILNAMHSQNHDFDWIEAERQCTASAHWDGVIKYLRQCVESRRKQFTPGDRQGKIEFRQDENTKITIDRRIDHVSLLLLVSLEGNEIRFREADPFKAPKELGVLSLQLNSDGDCRYQVNRRGEYLLWQAVRKVAWRFFRK